MNLLDLYLNQGNGRDGYSAPGRDPTGTATPETLDRTRNALVGSGLNWGGKAVANTIGNLARGMPAGYAATSLVGSAMNPGAIGGFLSAPLSAAFGVNPTTFGSKIASMGLKAGASVLGPVTGLMAGVLGDFAIDGLSDFADARSDEKKRDDMEDTLGWGPGHNAYADERDIRSRQQKAQSHIAGLAGALATQKAIQSMYDHYGYASPHDRAMSSTMSGGRGNSYGGRGDFASLDLSGGFGNTTYGKGPYGALDFSVAGKPLGLGFGGVGGGGSSAGHNVGGARGSSTGTGGGYNDGRGGVTGL